MCSGNVFFFIFAPFWLEIEIGYALNAVKTVQRGMRGEKKDVSIWYQKVCENTFKPKILFFKGKKAQSYFKGKTKGKYFYATLEALKNSLICSENLSCVCAFLICLNNAEFASKVIAPKNGYFSSSMHAQKLNV